MLPSYDLLVQRRRLPRGRRRTKKIAIGCSAPRTPRTARIRSRCMPRVIRTWRLKRPTIKWEPTRFGIKETTWIEDVSKPRISHYVFPSHVRHSAARVGEQPRQVIRFRVPTDDVTTTTFWIDFYPHKEGKPTQTDAVVRQRI